MFLLKLQSIILKNKQDVEQNVFLMVFGIVVIFCNILVHAHIVIRPCGQVSDKKNFTCPIFRNRVEMK